MKALTSIFTPNPAKIREDAIRETEIELVKATSHLARAKAHHAMLTDALAELKKVHLTSDGEAPATGAEGSIEPKMLEAA